MDYFDRLEAETHKLYEIANEARSKGLDVETKTEVPLAKDLAERVEGLVGPEGVAKRIKELEKDMSREEVAFEIAAEIASAKFELTGEKADYDEEQRCDQGLRTALAILTEGVVAAPLEGISQVKIKNNFDSTKYIAVYFAGPIRSAGGTAAALAVLLGDKIRRAIEIDEFKPIDQLLICSNLTMTFWSIPWNFLCTNLCTFRALNNQKGLKISLGYSKTHNITTMKHRIFKPIAQKLCI